MNKESLKKAILDTVRELVVSPDFNVQNEAQMELLIALKNALDAIKKL